MVERGLGAGIGDGILLDGITARVKVEKNSTVVHDDKNGTMDKLLEAMDTMGGSDHQSIITLSEEKS